MHELAALLGHQTMGLGLGVAVGLAVQHDRWGGTNGIDLERRVVTGMTITARQPSSAAAGNPLSVVSG